jgi:hypothetical protein
MPSAIEARKRKTPIKTYGWIMNWKPIRTVDGDKFGEELTIKTMFKKSFGSESMSVYLVNVMIKNPEMIETVVTSKKPLPVIVEGTKKWEKIYNNVEANELESTRKLVWIGMNRRGLSVKIVDAVPGDVLEKTGVAPPVMTFREYQKSSR